MQASTRKRGGAILVAASLLVAAGLAAGWMWGRERPGAQADRQGAPAQAPDASAPGAAPTASSSPRPLPAGRFQDIRGALEVRARAGDAQAAYRLGEVLGRCPGYEPMPGGAFTDLLARTIAKSGTTMLRIGDRKLDDPDVLDMMLYAKDQADAICGDVGDLAGSVRKGEAREWMELAAERGHTQAMVDYGNFAFEDLPSDGDLLDHAEEVAQRRERARGYLRRAFEAGDADAMLALAAAHGNKPYLGRDTTQSLAYFKAYRRTAAARKLPRGVINMIEQQLTQNASAQELRDSEQRSAQILQAFQQRRAPR